MKIKSVLNTALLGTAALLLVGASAKAALTYNTGDVFIGFRTTGDGSGQDLLIDIGSYTQFTSGTSFTLNINTVGADLVSVFGSDWNTRGDVSWGIIGTSYDGITNTSPIIYASRQENQSTLAQSIPWKGKPDGTQTGTAGNVQNLAGYYSSIGTATRVGGTSTIQDAGNAASYSAWTSVPSDFGAYSTIEGNFTSGTSHSVLDFYQVNPVNNQTSVYEGKFTINDSGTISYVAAVPEPSTYGLLIGTSMFVFMVARARRKAISNV